MSPNQSSQQHPRTVRIAIVGAGFSGIGLALKLRAAGHSDLVVYERASDVGGTWFHNSYPGAACDAPSHVYSYSFAQDVEWSRRFAPGPEIRAYLRRCVDDGGIDRLIQTGADVISARWTGDGWSILLADGRQDRADVLIPAVGQLTAPSVPDVPGLREFRGPSFHTAEWRHDVDLRGKRVAVIGTGASAIQVIPAIAPEVSHLSVFQRSAPYVLIKSDVAYSTKLHRRYRAVPLLKYAARQAIWSYLELVTAAFTRWPTGLRVLERYHDHILSSDIADPELRARLKPNFRIGCRRILISDDYYATLAREDVTLVTDRVEAVRGDAIVTTSGEYPVDVIVFATGFITTPFVSTIAIYGRSGLALAAKWADRSGAFLGLSVPGFPNMFLMYGPNTNLGSGSIIYMLEAQADHIVDAVNIIAADPKAVVEVTEGAYRKFLSDTERRQRKTVWAGCRSWYHDEQGRDTHNWPGLMSTYRRRSRRVRRADYTVTRSDGGI